MAQVLPDKLKFHYIKSNGYREISCDGAIGGPTPQGRIWVAFYAERFPLPQVVEHTILPVEGEGSAYTIDASEKANVIEAKDGIIRNVEIGTYLSVEAAEALRDWLDRNIKMVRKGG